MLDRITALFSASEEVTLEPGAAPDFHADRNERALADAREEAGRLRSEALDAVDAVEDALDELEAVDHAIQTVTDVTTNVARERRRAIASFDPPEDIAAFHEELAEMVEEWGQVTQKERAVLDRAGDAPGQVFSRISTVKDHADSIESFLQGSYRVLERQDRLELLAARHEELTGKRSALTEEIGGISLDDLREQGAAVEAELEELADDPRHDEMDAIRNEISDLESERDALESKVSSAASGMDRGLKKLLYAARNGDVSLPGDHLAPLDAVRDGNLLGADAPDPADLEVALDAAEERIAQVDLSDRQVRRFRDAADTLRDLADIREDIRELNESIAAKQDELDAFELDQEREQLERKRERIESRIQDRAAERKRLREEKRDVEDQMDGVVGEMEEVLDGAVRQDVVVE